MNVDVSTEVIERPKREVAEFARAMRSANRKELAALEKLLETRRE